MKLSGTIEGEASAHGMRVALVAARFNATIVDRLRAGAVEALVQRGAQATDVTTVFVPGAFEIPLAVRKLAILGRHDAIVALGAVIKGATAHFDYVAGQCASGLARVSQETGVPIAFGVLTTDTIEQAIERAGTKAGNKGADAAVTAIELANLLRRIES